ncbi:recombinase family protein [Rhizobium sp. ARZ01]|uniref:recombinase family protein n=1 Tax=Rhizobium sp. ARZ01 TaxID=2769313 RepID=UPI001FF031E7|nr:recombinase family protein [Rhizobium sp. ARZ01]
MSPRDIAQLLNKEGVPGSRGLKWRDTAIRGHVSRGTGILNNESYIGRMIWNKRNYRKNPATERRTARVNDASAWVLTDVPSMRIVPDKLWQRVKERQKEIGELFDFGQSNRLNATHRPEYLLSHLLECAECGGPYAISGKDRYSCTNRKKRLPIDDLGGACCGNSKTITRQELEQRVLDCLPAAFFSIGVFDTMSAKAIEQEASKLRRPEAEREHMKRDLKELERKQKNIIQQISDRALQDRPPLAALDDILDQLEVQRTALAKDLDAFATSEPDMTAKIEELRKRHDPAQTELRMRHFFLQARRGKNEDAKRQIMPIVRSLVQKVVIGKTPGHQPATLEVHGLIASILAQMDVLDYMERRFVAEVHTDFIEKLEAGEIETKEKQQKLLDAYAEELSAKRLEWQNIQASVVAGAGFEPAAFRL